MLPKRLRTTALRVYESYTVNGRNIVHYLGQFQVKLLLPSFTESDCYVPSLIRRRGNFYGMQIIGMTEYEPPMIYFPRDFDKKVAYFPNNKTYDITYIVNGYFMDALHSLEKKYNFTMKLYKRKDAGWGMPQTLSNGSIVATGMLQNINDGSAEFIWAPMAIKLERTLIVDFLPIMDRATAAIYIPATGNFTDIDWTIFTAPFTKQLWQGLFISSALIAICFYFMECILSSDRPVSQQFLK